MKRVATTARILACPVGGEQLWILRGGAGTAACVPQGQTSQGCPRAPWICAARLGGKGGEHNLAAQISHVDGEDLSLEAEQPAWCAELQRGTQRVAVKRTAARLDPRYFDDPSVEDGRFPQFQLAPGSFPSAPGAALHADPSRLLWLDPAPFSLVESLRHDPAFLAVVSVEEQESAPCSATRSLDQGPFVPVVIRQQVKAGAGAKRHRPVDPPVWRFEGIVFSHTVEADQGRLEFERCAVLAAEVHSTDLEGPC